MAELEHEPSVYVDSFLNTFFSEIVSAIEFEESFAQKYNLSKPKADYFKLKRFLTTAIRNFREIDDKFIAGLLLKLQKDVYSLFDFFQKFQSQTQVADIIYQRDFLTSLRPYQVVQDECRTSKATRDLFESRLKQLDEQMKFLLLQADGNIEKAKELKIVKDKYADAVHNFALARDKTIELSGVLQKYTEMFHPLFISEFNTRKSVYQKRLSDSINIKSYYLDRLLWDRAEQNRRIVEFMSAAGIVGNYDTKTFIKYYLRNIHIETSSDKDWHNYLKYAMEMLD